MMTNNDIELAQIVAMSNNFCIGKDNDLPWHLPDDLQHFKRQTTHNIDGTLAGHADNPFNGVMVMGRKTFESMRSRPLPKRVNIIITRQADYAEQKGLTEWITQGKIIVVNSLDDAIEIGKQQALQYQLKTVWIIGGGEIFKQSLPLISRIELTQVDIEVDGDAFYPAINDNFNHVHQSDLQTDNQQNIHYHFLRYQRS